MEKLKRNEGITLVALVVTIIVLLILAGVSLSGVFSDKGIFSRAEQSATEHRAGTVEDEVTVWKNEKQIAKYEQSTVANREELIESQKLRGLLTEEEAETAKATGKVKIGTKTIDYGEDDTPNTLVAMFKKAQEENCLDGKSCTKPGEHVHVGDYVVNYNSTLTNAGQQVVLGGQETGVDFEQTYSVDTATTWRVAGLSKDGTQLIITSGSPLKKQMNSSSENDYLKDPYLYLEGAEGWYHTNDELTNDNILDRVSKIYDSKYANKIASMRIEDIETLLGIAIEKDGENSRAYKVGDTSKTSLGEGTLKHFFGRSYTYQNGNYAPENYLKEKYPTDTRYNNITVKSAGDSVDGSAYSYTITNSNVVDQSSKIFDVLFKDTIEEPWSKSYWLASSGSYSDYCNFGPGIVRYGYAGCFRFSPIRFRWI